MALRKRGWVPTPAPARFRGLLPPLAVQLAHDHRRVTLALYALVPGQWADPEATFDLLWDQRQHRTLRATAVPVVDLAVLASNADSRPLPSMRYTSARLATESVSGPTRWCLAYLEAPREGRKALRRLARSRIRERKNPSGYGSAVWRVVAAFTGARHRWAQTYGV